MSKPLAERIRPQTLDDYIGQQHLVGPGTFLRKSIDNKRLPSMILWGPPGVGKTSLAQIIATTMGMEFAALSAIDSGVKEVRQVINLAQMKGQIVLFIDEIHRFNKGQQDSLLKAVEEGIITLIGATTENPSFEVISALLSRAQVYVLKAFEAEDLKALLQRAIDQDEEMQRRKVSIKEYEALMKYSGGDGRRLLNLLELSVQASDAFTVVVTNELVEQVAKTQMSAYDKSGEQHYDIASAMIKSIRGGDPDAALYWMARMIKGGENPRFIARRLLIAASEDIGLANPTAFVMANNCFQAVDVVGYPECELILSQTIIYLATSPKSNSAYLAIKRAKRLVEETGDLPVPLHLRNAPTKLMKKLDYGKGYQYAHDHPGNFVAQDYLPDSLKGTVFFQTGTHPREQVIQKQLEHWWPERY